jgi:hypothetical protein
MNEMLGLVLAVVLLTFVILFAWWIDDPSNNIAMWWHRSGWKVIATVAVSLAIFFGVTAGIQRAELQGHHLHIDPTGPNWADIVTALSTSVLALAALLALAAIGESRRARNALQMTELSRRWDEQINQKARQKVVDYAKAPGPEGAAYDSPGPDGLKASVLKLREDNADDYRLLLTDPNILEDLAILVERGGVDFGIVNLSLGWIVAYRWSLWKPTVDAFRTEAEEQLIYSEFEKLAKRIAKKNPESVKVDAAGEIIWDRFRE